MGRFGRYYIILTCFVALAPVLGAIEIEADRPAGPEAPTAGRSTLDRQELDDSAAGSVGEVLPLVLGVALSDYGAPGSQKTVSIRGSTSNQVLVLVDGVPVATALDGLADLSLLDSAMDSLAQIEVLRGAASAWYGPDALGGVLALRRLPPSLRPALRVAVGNTLRLPLKTWRGNGFQSVEVRADGADLVDGQRASVGLRIGSGLYLDLGWAGARNRYAYTDASGVARRRENADFQLLRGGLDWRTDGAGLVWSGGVSGLYQEQGVPGSVASPSPEARQADGGGRVWSRLEIPAFGGPDLGFAALIHGAVQDKAYKADAAAIPEPRTSWKAGLALDWVWFPARDLSWRWGLGGGYDRLDSPAIRMPDGSSPERPAIHAQSEVEWTMGDFSLVPALRYDWTMPYEPGLSAALGSALRLDAATSLSLNLATAYRAPSFSDLYWPADPWAAGNPAVQPERAWSADLGLRHKTPGLDAAAWVYGRYVQGVILWQPGADSIWRPSNYGDGFYPGLELELQGAGELEGGGRLFWRTGYSFVHSFALTGALDLADDRRIPMIPVHSLGALGGFSRKNLTLTLGLQARSLRYRSLDNVVSLPPSTTLRASMVLELGGGWRCSLVAANLLDEAREAVAGYPLPGFGLQMDLEWREPVPLGSAKP